MERSSWERALARAVTDRQFRARLLADPAGTLSEYGLTSQDRPLVDALSKTPTLAQLAAGFLHLAATAWAQPTPASMRYAEDPFLTPYPSLAGHSEEPWISSVLVPLDQLPPALDADSGISIRIFKGGAGATGHSSSGKHKGIRFYRNPEKPSRQSPSLPDEQEGDDAVNF